MQIDSYSLFKKDFSKKSKYKLESFTAPYEPLHRASKKSGEIVLYVSQVPEHIREKARHKPALELSGAAGHISGLFIPDNNRQEIGYGDIKGTEDGLIWFKTCCQIELFVFKGKKAVVSSILSMLMDNDPDLEAEIEACRQRTDKTKNDFQVSEIA